MTNVIDAGLSHSTLSNLIDWTRRAALEVCILSGLTTSRLEPSILWKSSPTTSTSLILFRLAITMPPAEDQLASSSTERRPLSPDPRVSYLGPSSRSTVQAMSKAAETTPLLVAAQPAVMAEQPWDDGDSFPEHTSKTNWQHEAKILAKYSAPLILTHLLHYGITIGSVLAVGRIGTLELGAVNCRCQSSD